MILMFMGHLVEAQRTIERAFRAYEESSESDRLAARAAGQDAGVADLSLMSWTLWMLGRPDYAVRRVEEALQRANAIGHPHSQAYASYYASVLYALRGEAAQARAHAERCMTLAEAHGFRQWHGLARTVAGTMTALLEGPIALEAVNSALEQYRAAGYQLGITTVHVLLCQALLHHDEFERALEVAKAGLAIVEKNDERLFEAELYRMLALAQLGAGKAELSATAAILGGGLLIAEAQGARALALRLACDLAEIHLRSERSGDARAELGPLLGFFREGDTTQDLKRARAILGRLPS